MARLSDIIEAFIKQSLQKNDDSEIQIQRNELANFFSCAPSQINYVLTTRFTTDRGYSIESKRGGGGCIVIRKVEIVKNESLADLIAEKIGNSLTYDKAVYIIDSLLDEDIITERESKIIKAAVNDRNLRTAERKNEIRADLLKAIILIVLE